MELRVLEYFLAVAREESITGAAKALHLSQPTLSRQLKDLEEELGKQLFIRGSKRIELTEEGKLLRKRAQEIVSLADKAREEISLNSDSISGEIYIGAGETDAVHYITDAAKRVQKQYPDIRFHIISGDGTVVKDMLDNGLIDLGLIFDNVDYVKYDAVTIPIKDNWGVLMRKNSPLANNSEITAKDLYALPLIVSRQVLDGGILKQILGKPENELNIAGTYSLIFNGSLMVKSGLGYALCLDKIINVSGDSGLTFLPLAPSKTANIHIIWKKNNVFSKATQLLLNEIGKE